MARLQRSLASEWRKITATKTWWVLAITFTLYAAMMAAPFGLMFGELQDESQPLNLDGAATMVYSTTATLGYVIPLVYGALAATNELRHRTLGVTFTVEPRRGVVLGAKAIALAVVGVIFALAGLGGAVGAGAGMLSVGDVPTLLNEAGTWAMMGRVAVVIALWAIIGFGMGLIVKNQAFAIVIAIVFTQFLEPVARIGAQVWDWSATVGKFLPGAAMDAFVGASILNDMTSLDPSMPESVETLSMGAGLSVLIVYAAVFCALGWVLRMRADVS